MDLTIVITLVAYKILLLGIGFWANKRTHTTGDFFLGGRQLGSVVAAVSYCASSSSAWTLLGMSGVAYTIGISSVWLACGAIFGASFAWLWVAPRLMRYSHRNNILTLTEFLSEGSTITQETRIRVLATCIILFSFIFYISAQFQGAGNTFETTLNLGFKESIILGGLIIVIYTLLGGFWAVSLTDTIQGLMMLLAAIVLPILALLEAGGYQGIHNALASQQLDALLTLSFSNTGLAAVGFIVGGLSVGFSTFGQPHLVSRFMALKNEKALASARWIAIAWFTIVFFGMCILGLSVRVILPEIGNPETLFFQAASILLPPIIGGVMIAAVLSAIMSTADSMLLVGAASVAHDLRLATRYPGKELIVARLAMVGLSIAAILLALNLPASIFDRALFAWVAIGSAFGPILLVKLSGMKIPANGILLAMTCSFVLAIIFYYLPNTPGDIAERTLPFFAGLIILILASKRHSEFTINTDCC